MNSDNSNNPWYNDPAPVKPAPPKQEEGRAQQDQAQQQGQDQAIKKVKKQMGLSMLGKTGAAIIVILVAIGAIYFLGSLGSQGQGSTTSIVTTINQAAMEINGCMNITSPGAYYLSKGMNVTVESGACINIKSNNVQLIGDQNKIRGSGPFVGIPPFTYGIYVNNQKNVSVSGFSLSSFSYGIYLNNTTNSTLTFNNATMMAISGIALNNSSNNLIVNNTVSNAASQNGGIYLYKSQHNRVIHDVIINNANYGLVSNSTNNTFQNDVFSNNPIDLYCPFLSTSFRDSNLFGSSSCNTNNFCNFAQCTTTNLPSDISSFTLNPPAISSCGGVIYAGKYSLSKNINMNNYLNASNPLAQRQSCLKINAPNVEINCNGYTISNAPYAINASGQFNTTIKNCVLLNNSVAGISADSNFNIRIANTTVLGGRFGLQMTNGTIATITNVTTSNNIYGVYVNSSGAFSIGNFNSSNNVYGAYIDGTIGIIMSGGRLFNNTKSDLWCTATTYNSSQNQFQSTQLGKTDCKWATSAATFQKPPISVFPVNSCYSVVQGGNYTLSANVIATNKCISILAPNVNFDCKNFQIANANRTGTAIFVAPGMNNVEISNCQIKNFNYGIVASNSSGFVVQKNNIVGATTGIWLSNMSSAQVLTNYVQSARGISTYILNFLSGSSVFGNIAFDTAGQNLTGGFIISNTFATQISFNNATNTAGYGFVFANTVNNNIFNNTAKINGNADYFCDNASSGLYVEQGGINIGDVEMHCKWMVAINPITTLSQQCLAITSGTTVILSSDMVYKFGGTCFTIHNNPPLQVVNDSARPATSANNSVINCAYHTVLASHGGTFVSIVNSSSVVVENCYLKNFTNGVVATGFGPIVRNNTFTSISNTSVSLHNAQYAKVLNNRILNASVGIYMSYVRYSTLSKNFMGNVNSSIFVFSGVGNLVNTTNSSHGVSGLTLGNTSTNNFQNNKLLNMSSYGVSCVQGSGNVLSQNKDLGGNICSLNNGCMWMSGSSCLSH